jgi:hypothetical protein
MRHIWLFGLGLILAGCTTTQQANTSMQATFVGKPADDFFLQYGPPIATHQLDDGRHMYLWTEGRHDFYLPGTTTGTVTLAGNTAWWNGWTTPPTDVNVECVLRIVTKAGIIQQIMAQSDSIGMWQTSRCNELFGGHG